LLYSSLLEIQLFILIGQYPLRKQMNIAVFALRLKQGGRESPLMPDSAQKLVALKGFRFD